MIALSLFVFAALAANVDTSELSTPNVLEENLDERNFDRDEKIEKNDVVNALLPPQNDERNFHPISDENNSEESEKMEIHRRIIPDESQKSGRQIEFDRNYSGEGIPIIHEKLELTEENVAKLEDANPPEVIKQLRDGLRVQKEKMRLREKHARENADDLLEMEKKVSLKSELEKAVNDFHNSREFEELQQNVDAAPETLVGTEEGTDVKREETFDDSEPQNSSAWACLAAVCLVALLIFGAIKCARKLKNQGDMTAEEEFFIGESYDIWSPPFRNRKHSGHIE